MRPSTLRKYRNTLRKFVAFATSRSLTSWNQVRSETVAAYASYLEEEEYAPNTQSFDLTTLLQAVKWLTQNGHLPGGFRVRFSVKTPDGSDAYCWTGEEVLALRDHCLAQPELAWLAAPLLTLALTGLRISELTGLRWSNLDLRAGMLTLVDESKQAPSKRKGRKAQAIKTGRRRTFPIREDLKPVLRALPRHADGFVFRGPDDGRITDRVVRSGLKQAQAALAERFPTPREDQGFADGTPHPFRHFFCSTCANAGGSGADGDGLAGPQKQRDGPPYYHVHDREAREQMSRIRFGGRLTA